MNLCLFFPAEGDGPEEQFEALDRSVDKLAGFVGFQPYLHAKGDNEDGLNSLEKLQQVHSLIYKIISYTFVYYSSPVTAAHRSTCMYSYITRSTIYVYIN